MKKSHVIKLTADMIKEKFTGEGSGHDWWHIYRVWQNAKTIASKENVDQYIVELGALLHDIADWKANNGDEKIGGVESRKWLESIGVEEDTILQVVHIVDKVSFKGGIEQNKMKSLEGKVVQDADRLDAIGAIGIARCFVGAGVYNEILHNPTLPLKNDYSSKEEYIKSRGKKGTAINHFYEKLMLLKDLMNTKSGKELAENRHEYMELFLQEFFAEWEGQK